MENVEEILCNLIRIKSISKQEFHILREIEILLSTLKGSISRIPVSENRYNILYSHGEPEIIFSTHVDVVDGAPHLFSPTIKEGFVFGRGACDAKGSLVAMYFAIKNLEFKGAKNIGLLFVVGEEDDGIGAQIADTFLSNQKVKFLINGEPTDNTLAKNTMGTIDLVYRFKGSSVHSGYPELGQDANDVMFKTVDSIRSLTKQQLNDANIKSINIGLIKGGLSASTISPVAELRVCVRTYCNTNSNAIKLLKSTVCEGECKVVFDSPYRDLFILNNLASKNVYFGSDIPNFVKLNSQFLMYGPGSILDAHTDTEKISLNDITQAITDYQDIYEELLDLN